MLTKLYNHAFQSEIFEILRDVDTKRERLVNADIFDGEFRIRYRKSSTETIYFVYPNREKMLSDYDNFLYLLEACETYNPDRLEL